MKPYFSPSESENEGEQKMCASSHQVRNKPLHELVANLGYKSPAEVKRIAKAAEKKGNKSLVESGVLKEGVPCVPVSLYRFHKGVKVEIVAQSRKFPLKDIRQSLLEAHEPFMRLHSDCEIDEISKEDILNILQHGACFSMQQFEKALWKS